MTTPTIGNLFLCSDLERGHWRPPVQTVCKENVYGRLVYRVTYPFRQLVSDLLMIPYTWTREAVKQTWNALDNRSCVVIRASLAILAGVGAFTAGLVLGTAVSSTFGLLRSIHDAIREVDIDRFDTLFEHKINTAIHGRRPNPYKGHLY